MLVNKICNVIRELRLKRQWRKKNKHNFTTMMHSFDAQKVHVGRYTYGALTVYTFNDENHLYIGDFCSIGPYVQFILSAEHDVRTVSTFPFKAKITNESKEGISKGDIIIGDDVWIGANAIILSGVNIGQGAVIAAGAVVNKDVAPYSIVGGVPAKEIKKRFTEDLICKLMEIDYSKVDRDFVEKNIDNLYTPVNQDNIMELISEFPKKERWFRNR